MPECNAGLNGARSGLFMEQIRIIQEMRDADRKSGRTGIHIRPRFGIWENVVGALSSGRDAETGQKKPGADFQKVLEAFLQVEEPYLHAVRPETGRWEYAGAYWEYDPPCLDRFGTLNTSECPKDAVECSLWQILQLQRHPILAISDSVPGYSAPRRVPRQIAATLIGNSFAYAAGLDPPAPISGEAKAYHINQRSEGIDLDGVSGALMATQNLQMQTFITNPGSSQSGPQKQIAFAANQRDEVRDLHDVAARCRLSRG